MCRSGCQVRRCAATRFCNVCSLDMSPTIGQTSSACSFTHCQNDCSTRLSRSHGLAGAVAAGSAGVEQSNPSDSFVDGELEVCWVESEAMCEPPPQPRSLRLAHRSVSGAQHHVGTVRTCGEWAAEAGHPAVDLSEREERSGVAQLRYRLDSLQQEFNYERVEKRLTTPCPVCTPNSAPPCCGCEANTACRQPGIERSKPTDRV